MEQAQKLLGLDNTTEPFYPSTKTLQLHTLHLLLLIEDVFVFTIIL